VTVRPRLALLAVAAASVLASPAADAQPRGVAVRRSVIAVRPTFVVRPRSTVFIGGYYSPSFYRAPLYYGGYRYGYFGAPFSYQWPPYGFGSYDLSGSVRLQVSPKQTEVFVDGYYAGTVDDFDGMFQRLNVEPGDHEIELYLAGHRIHRQRMYLQPGRTFTIRHSMEPLAAGEPEAERPSGAPLPARGGRDPQPAGGGVSAEQRPPSPARPDDSGELSVRVQPQDAEVIIDGETWAGTLDDERLVVQLAPGVHRLEIRKDGYRPYFTDVTIRTGETRRLNVALTRQ
jgi:hypothetical protein